MHSYKVNGQKTRWIKVLFLYPKALKLASYIYTSICKIIKFPRIIPRTPVIRGWGKGREKKGGRKEEGRG